MNDERYELAVNNVEEGLIKLQVLKKENKCLNKALHKLNEMMKKYNIKNIKELEVCFKEIIIDEAIENNE